MKKTLKISVMDGESVLYETTIDVEMGQQGGIVRLIDSALETYDANQG